MRAVRVSAKPLKQRWVTWLFFQMKNVCGALKLKRGLQCWNYAKNICKLVCERKRIIVEWREDLWRRSLKEGKTGCLKHKRLLSPPPPPPFITYTACTVGKKIQPATVSMKCDPTRLWIVQECVNIDIKQYNFNSQLSDQISKMRVNDWALLRIVLSLTQVSAVVNSVQLDAALSQTALTHAERWALTRRCPEPSKAWLSTVTDIAQLWVSAVSDSVPCPCNTCRWLSVYLRILELLKN